MRHLKRTQEGRPMITLLVDDDDTDISLNTSSSTSRPPQPALRANPHTNQVTEKQTRSGRLVRPPSRYGDN